jgi:predicted 2-oxoglutarate/Fe(II)-dependent dioxygenase YbiX
VNQTQIDFLAERKVSIHQHPFATFPVERIRELMLAAHAADATTTALKDDAPALRQEYRRTQKLTMPSPLPAALSAELAANVARVAAFYNMARHGLQEYQWLLYRPGDYFTRHKDGSLDPAAPPHVQARRISVVTFLADAGPGRDFGGGELILYFKSRGPNGMEIETAVTIVPERGLVVAFPATLAHEVRPIDSGVRLSAVTWLTEA